jgi:hypothetical protein
MDGSAAVSIRSLCGKKKDDAPFRLRASLM